MIAYDNSVMCCYVKHKNVLCLYVLKCLMHVIFFSREVTTRPCREISLMGMILFPMLRLLRPTPLRLLLPTKRLLPPTPRLLNPTLRLLRPMPLRLLLPTPPRLLIPTHRLPIPMRRLMPLNPGLLLRQKNRRQR